MALRAIGESKKYTTLRHDFYQVWKPVRVILKCVLYVFY